MTCFHHLLGTYRCSSVDLLHWYCATEGSSYLKIFARPLQRNDLPMKARGTYQYMQHQRLPGMLHGRIVRPRGQGAYKDGIQGVAVDESSIASISGARVLRKGNFIGVVAEREWDAVQAAQQLKVTWTHPENLPGNKDLFTQMEATPTTDRVARDEGDVSVYANAPYKAEFFATGPYQAHAPFAPNCALADVSAPVLSYFAHPGLWHSHGIANCSGLCLSRFVCNITKVRGRSPFVLG